MLKFVEVLFVGRDFIFSIISVHLTIESPILLAYLPFWQLCIPGFQKSPFSHWCSFGFLHSHQHLSLFRFDSSFIFYHQTYIHICMIYVLLTFLICLFLLSYKKHGSLSLLSHLEHIFCWIDHQEYCNFQYTYKHKQIVT